LLNFMRESWMLLSSLLTLGCSINRFATTQGQTQHPLGELGP
jgi:hypothetical protein